jgi:hypothetical protein
MSREYLLCPPQMRNGGPPPAHLSSSTAFAESRCLYPPQRAPDTLGQSISDFLAQCRQIETDGREALVAHHEECHRYWAENMRNGGSPPAHLSSSTAFALKKDFSRHREEAELNNELIDRRRHDKATRAMAIDGEGLRLMTEERRRNKTACATAFDDKWLRLTEEARIAFDDEEHRHSRHLAVLFEQVRQNEAACTNLLAEEVNLLAAECRGTNLLAKECRRNKASRAKGFDNAWLCLKLKEEARITFDDEECCHRRHLAALLKRLRHCQEAAAQAAVSAVLLLAEDRRRHEAHELATHMRSLAASRDCANIEAIAYEAPALPTTTSPEPPAMLSPSPRPTSSYLGAVLNINGGGHSSLHSMSPTVAAPLSR